MTTPIITTLLYLSFAIAEVESNHNATAHNLKEDAVGCMQIRPICVREGQRIGLNFTLEDRWDCKKSKLFFIKYQIKKGMTNPEEIARKWNGGGKGMTMEATLPYWEKVQDALSKFKR
jgi:hypothetical protein